MTHVPNHSSSPRAPYCVAFGRVVGRLIYEQGLVKQDLGYLLGDIRSKGSASAKAQKLCSGLLAVPDEHLPAVAEFLGLTQGDLLRLAASELDSLEVTP